MEIQHKICHNKSSKAKFLLIYYPIESIFFLFFNSSLVGEQFLNGLKILFDSKIKNRFSLKLPKAFQPFPRISISYLPYATGTFLEKSFSVNKFRINLLVFHVHPFGPHTRAANDSNWFRRKKSNTNKTSSWILLWCH